MVRNLVRQAGKAYVFTGPIFDNDQVDTIGDDEVGVPTRTFKVILALGPGDTKRMYAVIMPNEDGVKDPVNSFTTTVRAIEDKTGFDFFSTLPKAEQEEMETRKESFDENLISKKKMKPKKNRT
jgi:DNA/RNA endonuclease G (NUC1)